MPTSGRETSPKAKPMNKVDERRRVDTDARGVVAEMSCFLTSRGCGSDRNFENNSFDNEPGRLQGQNAMSIPQLSDLFGRFIAALNAHEMNRMEEFLHENVVVNRVPATRAEIIARLHGLVQAVPDFGWRVQAIAVTGDIVAARLCNSGTPAATSLDPEPAAATLEYPEYAIHKVRDGRFYEMNFAADIRSMHE